MANKISPQGYAYGSEPKSIHPFWGGGSVSVDEYVKYLTLAVSDTGVITLSYVDQDGNTQVLSPSWNEKGEKGDPGEKGADGAQGEAGVTPDISATASVDDTTGTPSVSVTKTGTTEAPSFAFDFKGLKGAQGEQGEKGDPGATGETGPQGETGPAGSDATVSVTKAISGNQLKQTITSGENNYETDFPADYVTDVTAKDVAITEATTTDVDNDLQNVTPQLITMNVATAIRETEDTLTESSHEIVCGVAYESAEAGSTDSYLYFLTRVYSENNIIYALYYRQSDNSYIRVKLLDASTNGTTVTNEASGTDGVNKVTIGDQSIYILTEPMAITGLEQTTDSSTNTTTTAIKMSGVDQSGNNVTDEIDAIVQQNDYYDTLALQHKNLNETEQNVLTVPKIDAHVGLNKSYFAYHGRKNYITFHASDGNNYLLSTGLVVTNEGALVFGRYNLTVDLTSITLTIYYYDEGIKVITQELYFTSTGEFARRTFFGPLFYNSGVVGREHTLYDKSGNVVFFESNTMLFMYLENTSTANIVGTEVKGVNQIYIDNGALTRNTGTAYNVISISASLSLSVVSHTTSVETFYIEKQ